MEATYAEIRGVEIIPALLSIPFLCAGVAAYKGIWREWKGYIRFIYDGPSCMVMGVWLVLIAISPNLLLFYPWYMVFIYFAPIVFLLVLPRSEWPLFLLPGWYVEEIRADRVVEMAKKRLRRDRRRFIRAKRKQMRTRLDSRGLGFPLEDVSGLGVPQVTRSVPVETKYVDVVAGFGSISTN